MEQQNRNLDAEKTDKSLYTICENTIKIKIIIIIIIIIVHYVSI